MQSDLKTAPNNRLNSRERTQIAYLANALVHAPERHVEFLAISLEESLGSPGIAEVVAALRCRFQTGKVVDMKLLEKIAGAFVLRVGPCCYAGQALLGSLACACGTPPAST